jgi:hypothetical protein
MGQESSLAIFISHSSKDKEVADRMIDLLRAALTIRHDLIRCTSISGYRLEIGQLITEALRLEVLSARVFIGIITPNSLRSAYVLFELGARWGAGGGIAPVLACGARASQLEGPVKEYHALKCTDRDEMNQFVRDLGRKLQMELAGAEIYQKQIDRLVEASSKDAVAEIGFEEIKDAIFERGGPSQEDSEIGSTQKKMLESLRDGPKTYDEIGNWLRVVDGSDTRPSEMRKQFEELLQFRAIRLAGNDRYELTKKGLDSL